jgi:hypothetical protein
MQIGGQSGPSLNLKDPTKSKILSVLNYEGSEMPPAGQLPKETIADFKTWIAMGAPDPRKKEVKARKKKIDFEKERHTWVY